MIDEYVNGYIQRRTDGGYDGKVSVDGVDLSPIEAVYFKQEGRNYVWLKRKPIMEYDFETQSYRTRQRRPQWEAYLEKQVDGSTVAYKGEFTFLKFKYSIVGVWDYVLAKDKKRLNLFIERLPMNKQTIISAIKERKVYGGAGNKELE